MTALPTAHSPLGGSSMHRVLSCVASVALSKGIEASDFEDDTYSAPGTAAHDVAARCLKSGDDAWTLIGQKAENGIVVDREMANPVQSYVGDVREWHDITQGAKFGIEESFHCPTIHKLHYGTADFWYLDDRTLHVWDFKFGAGLVVEVPNNPQCMYYACGVLEMLDLWEDVDTAVLHIHQPRIEWHYEGVHRTWEIGTSDLLTWLEDVLIPTMNEAEAVLAGEVSRDPVTGDHCRFCPVRFKFWTCKAVMADLAEMEVLMDKAEKQGASKLEAAEIGRLLTLGERFPAIKKAALAVGTGIANAGHDIPGWKLAKAKSNRIWKDDAQEAIEKEYGERAFSEPKLKSPAQIDTLPKGPDFSARYAYKPDAGETLVPVSDTRAAVKKASVKDAFAKKGKAA